MKALRELAEKAGGKVIGEAAVLAEGDAAKRKDYMMNLVGKDKIDVKELWWIPLDDQEALAVTPEAKIIEA